jgi:ubiquitin-large subunit ribosomal protein L40e
MPQFFVKSITGHTRTIEAETTDTISAIKERIYDKEGINPNEQRLIYAGKNLTDEKTINDYNIEPESTIHMSLRVVGGFKDGRCANCGYDLSLLKDMLEGPKEPIPWVPITGLPKMDISFCSIRCHTYFYNLQKVNYIAKIRYKSIKYHFIDSEWEQFDEVAASAMNLMEIIEFWNILKPLDQNHKRHMRNMFDEKGLVIECPENKPNY